MKTLRDFYGTHWTIDDDIVSSFTNFYIGIRTRSVLFDASLNGGSGSVFFLPDARRLKLGHKIHMLVNTTNALIYIARRNAAGSFVNFVAASAADPSPDIGLGDVVTLTLLDNSSYEGEWFLQVKASGGSANALGMESRTGTNPEDINDDILPTYTPDCSPIYALTPCGTDTPTIFTRSDLSASLNRAVLVSDVCYSVEIYRGFPDTLSITEPTVDEVFDDCSVCASVVVLISCLNPETTKVTNAILTPGILDYVGRIVTIEDAFGCWLVEVSAGEDPEAVVVVDVYDSCDEAACNIPLCYSEAGAEILDHRDIDPIGGAVDQIIYPLASFDADLEPLVEAFTLSINAIVAGQGGQINVQWAGGTPESPPEPTIIVSGAGSSTCSSTNSLLETTRYVRVAPGLDEWQVDGTGTIFEFNLLDLYAEIVSVSCNTCWSSLDGTPECFTSFNFGAGVCVEFYEGGSGAP